MPSPRNSAESASKKARRKNPFHVKPRMVAEAIQARNLQELSALALSSEGLASNELRRLGWPLLLRAEDSDAPPPSRWGPFWRPASERNRHAATLRQIELDVNRSYSHLQHAPPQFAEKRDALFALLRTFFARNPDLYYYQGFHDVAALCLDVLAEQALALAVLERMARHLGLRDAHRKEFDATESSLHLIPELVARTDPALGRVLSRTSPYWAVSLVISWFAHDLESREAVARIFDAIIASHPTFPLYLSAALVLCPRVAEALHGLPDPADTADVHELLRRVASKEFDTYTNANALVARARNLLAQVPPAELLKWARTGSKLPRDSVLFAPYPPDLGGATAAGAAWNWWAVGASLTMAALAAAVVSGHSRSLGAGAAYATVL